MINTVNLNVLAGNNLTGVYAVPATAPDDSVPGVLSFNSLTDGGLFVTSERAVQDSLPTTALENVRLERCDFDLGNATTWSLVLRGSDGLGGDLDTIIADETTEAGNTFKALRSYVGGTEIALVLAHEQLILVTAGATTAMRAQIVFSRW